MRVTWSYICRTPNVCILLHIGSCSRCFCKFNDKNAIDFHMVFWQNDKNTIEALHIVWKKVYLLLT